MGTTVTDNETPAAAAATRNFNARASDSTKSCNMALAREKGGRVTQGACDECGQLISELA